jgi:hypothetical protein
MTNAMIIENHRFALLEAGKIRSTGRILKVETPDGEVKEIPEPIEIHTFQCWKELGYKVKKGEHAVDSFQIWKYSSKKKDDETADAGDGRCFLKLSYFFSADQVERI